MWIVWLHLSKLKKLGHVRWSSISMEKMHSVFFVYECCTCTVHTATITMSGMTNTNIIHVDCSIVVTFIFLPNLLSASLSTWLLLVMRSSHVAKQMLFIIDKKCTALNIVAATKKRELCYCMATEAFFTLLAINELHFEWMQCANGQHRQSKTPLHRMKIENLK